MESICTSSDISANGYTLLRSVLSPAECLAMMAEVSSVMDAKIESDTGQVVGGRNLLSRWHGWRELVRRPMVAEVIAKHVGPNAGVVRILYFDKPPGKGWSLAMHKDRTIAVAAHRIPPGPFTKPTRKAGVPHVEASEELLSRMITLRIHLDAMHEKNGPLLVAPGSHLDDSNSQPLPILSEAGDIFVMRPLLSHGSLAADPGTTDHRRVVHLELAPEKTLPGGYEWHEFERCSATCR